MNQAHNGLPRRHARRKYSSAPPCLDRKSSQTFSVFVTMPSGTVCSIRNVPRPGTLEWINCQLELQTGLDAQMFNLHYPNCPNLADDHSLSQRSPQTGLILKLQLIDSFQDIFRTITSNDWDNLKNKLLESVQISKYDGTEEDSSSSDSTFCSLFLASNIGLDGLCRNIIETNPDVINKTSGFGHSVVHTAVCNDNSSTVELLLEHGADPTVTDMLGRTSLQIALHKGAKQCVNILRFFKFQPRAKVSDTKIDSSGFIGPTENGSATDVDDLGSKDDHGSSRTGRRMTLLMLNKARVKFRDNIVSRKSLAGSIIEEPSDNEPHHHTSAGSKEYFQKIARGLSLDESKINGAHADYRVSEGSPFRSLVHNRPNSASVMYGHLRKSVEFIVANRQDKLWDLQCPSSTPRSTTSSVLSEELSSDGRCPSSSISRVPTPADRARESSAGSCSNRSGRRSPQKLAPKAKWLSVKRKLRMAYLLQKATETKTGQNDAAYNQWFERKENEMKMQKRIRFKKVKSDNTEVNKKAFDKWLHAKSNEKINENVFRGMETSAFLIGSTMGGEPLYPDVMENKDSYRKWLQNHSSPHLGIQDNVSSGDFIKSEPYKKMERQRQKMLTSAVTYEEWLGAKYVQEQFHKELEALKIREKHKEVAESLASKSFHSSGYDKWTRRCQSKQRKVKFSTVE